MSKTKLWTLCLALGAIALLDILVYRNSHLYFQSQKTDDPQEKIAILGRAESFFPLNDLVFYELGKAHFDLGAGNLTDRGFSHKAFQESLISFRRSLTLNPGSYFCHYNLARTLDYLSFWDPAAGKEAFEEFRKAALLAGQNSQIYFEVGKVLFSSWPQLSNDNREFVTEILKKVGARKNLHEIQELFEIWEMNVNDYAVMEKILPEEASVFRAYAKFLGEKSLSLVERQKYLTLAESLEFRRATDEFSLGEEALVHFQTKEALERFNSCLDFLSQFRFYQDLTRQSLVDPGDFRRLRKLTYLGLAKCRIEDSGGLKDAVGYLRNYLWLEDEVTSVSELEAYLRKRGLLSENLESSAQDLDHLAFAVLLHYKQNKYGDILKISSLLEQSYVVIPPEKKDEYVEILQIIGGSYQKAGSYYEADRLYQKSLEINPLNLQALVRIRSIYERLNENEKLREINHKIEQVVSPKEILSAPTVFQKGQVMSSVLILDGRTINLEVTFQEQEDGEKPLVSLHFGGRVVWEDYVGSPSITLALDSEPGQNPLHFVSLNRPVSVVKIAYKNTPS